MDIVDQLLKSHASLRASFLALGDVLGRPTGVGWDDRSQFDQAAFSRGLACFFADFRAHEAAEDECLARITRRRGPDAGLDAAIADGHRSLADMTRILAAVVYSCDGEHLHGVHTVFARLGEDLERHLTYEETRVFPRLRELARRALARPA